MSPLGRASRVWLSLITLGLDSPTCGNLAREYTLAYDRGRRSRTFMRPLHLHLARVVVACAAVFGQFIPASAVWACGESCCSASASQSCCQRIRSTEQDFDSQCPLCGPQRTEQSPAPPCHCHLKARHDSATKVDGRTALDLQHLDHFAVVRVSNDSEETSAELTRLALAAGETIPYRPARIMYGVWRN